MEGGSYHHEKIANLWLQEYAFLHCYMANRLKIAKTKIKVKLNLKMLSE